jgi:hypothetical protein
MTFHFDHITYVVKSPAVNAILIVLMGLRYGVREEAPFAPFLRRLTAKSGLCSFLPIDSLGKI